MHWRAHPFLFICTPLLLIVVLISYYRFMIVKDYVVHYQSPCNPIVATCFTSCDDAACTEPSYYVKVTKTATHAYTECGSDVSVCDSANQCQIDERDCIIEYCTSDTVEQDEFCTGPEYASSSPSL